MYRLAVCEDEKELRETLCWMCGEILDELRVEHRAFPFSGAVELADVLLAGELFDLLRLDICLSSKSGMELTQELWEYDEQVSILFVTSSEEHLKEGYRIRPIQYLFKSVDREELMETIQTDLRLFHQRKSLVLRSGGGRWPFLWRTSCTVSTRWRCRQWRRTGASGSTWPRWSGCCRRGSSAAATTAFW